MSGYLLNLRDSLPYAVFEFVDPKLIDLSTSIGSEAGSTIYGVVIGRGVGDSVTLTDATGNDICESSAIIEYGLLECNVAPGTISTGVLTPKDTAASASAAAIDSAAADTTFGTVGSDLGPIISSI